MIKPFLSFGVINPHKKLVFRFRLLLEHICFTYLHKYSLFLFFNKKLRCNNCCNFGPYSLYTTNNQGYDVDINTDNNLSIRITLVGDGPLTITNSILTMDAYHFN